MHGPAACSQKLRLGAMVTALTVMRVLGLLASVYPLLHMHRIQRSLTCQEAQALSGDRSPISAGRPTSLGVSTSYIIRNASGLNDLIFIPDRVKGYLPGEGGSCCVAHRGKHINLLKLQAVFLVLQCFKPLVQGKHMLVRADNHITVAYINWQGGVQSPSLLKMEENLWLRASEHLFFLEALHVSRGSPALDHSLSLGGSVTEGGSKRLESNYP